MGKALKVILMIFVIFVQISLMITYSYDSTNIIMMLFGTSLLLYRITQYKDLSTCFCSLFMALSIFLSLQVTALFRMRDSELQNYSYASYHDLAIFGNELLVVVLFFDVLFNILIKKKKEAENIVSGNGKIISKSTFYVFYVISLGVSLLSLYFGMSRMGTEDRVILPFHLNGIIYMYRSVLVPYLIFTFVHNRLSNKKEISNFEWILIFFYGLVEVYVRMSKSALINVFFPIFVYYIVGKRLNAQSFVKVVMPVILVFFLLYPVVGALRMEDNISAQKVADVYKESEGNDTGKDIYNRFFSAGGHYMNCYYLFKDGPFFDFSRLPFVIMERGSAGFYTHVVLGISRDKKHSSGTTGITDPYLIGGKGFCYLVLILVTLIGVLVDKRIGKSQILHKVLLIQIFYTLVLYKNVTIFIDDLFLSFVGTTTIQLFLIFKYRKSYETRSKVNLRKIVNVRKDK